MNTFFERRSAMRMLIGQTLVVAFFIASTAAAQESPRPTREERAVQRQIKVFQLRQAAARDIATVLRQVVGTDEPISLGIDERTNTVIVSAPKQETLDVVEALVAKLEDAGARAPADVPDRYGSEPREMRVRVVWLASGPGTKPAPGGERHESFSAPPKDLQPVVEELEKLGLGDVVMVSQTVLTASTSGNFRSQGTVWAPVSIEGAHAAPCELAINGAGQAAYGERIQLSVRVTADKPDLVVRNKTNKETLVAIETEVATPPGHFVVLGVSPAGPITSAFVVQVTPTDSSPRPKGKAPGQR
jgi:hypothetical protein